MGIMNNPPECIHPPHSGTIRSVPLTNTPILEACWHRMQAPDGDIPPAEASDQGKEEGEE